MFVFSDSHRAMFFGALLVSGRSEVSYFKREVDLFVKPCCMICSLARRRFLSRAFSSSGANNAGNLSRAMRTSRIVSSFAHESVDG
jgi:hypothetical protein